MFQKILCCLVFLICFVGEAYACPTCTANDPTTDSYVERLTNYSAGDVITTQLSYFDVEAVGGSNQAMVFDSHNPTGGDWDLGVRRGNLLMISEDGDASDPDDNARGGKLILTAKNNVTVFRKVVLVDVEEGARVIAKKNGQVVFNKYYTTRNGRYRTVFIEHQVNGKWVLDEADTLEIHFNGSGAIDDVEVCYRECVLDACGVCNGPGPQLLGCDGELYCENPPVVDECGVCAGEGPTKLGCDGELYCSNPPVVDSCGICGGEGPELLGCDGQLYCENPPVVDSCGVCGGSGPKFLGCDGKLYCSDAPVVDECGVCGGTGPKLRGCDGKLYCSNPPKTDSCGVCGGDGPQLLGCDGNLYCENPPVVDSCGVCGGDGPQVPGCDGRYYCSNAPVTDECGVCGGDNSTCVDCFGVINGGAVVDECGICGGDGSTCEEIEVCREIGNTASVITIPAYAFNHVTDSRNLEDCDPVKICYENQTLTVPAIVAENYTGAVPGECIIEDLECKVCAEVNAFLGQVNVASVINVSDKPLLFSVSYTDMFGVVVDTLEFSVAAYQKQDVIVNNMGLEPDTYGTVCVLASESSKGLWRGGVTVYKEKFGTNFTELEYALYYPFTNPRSGAQIVPLNSHRIGASKVAQWIRITDSAPSSCGPEGVEVGIGLTGKLYVYQSNAETFLACEYDVSILPGGRFDYSAHDCLDDDHSGYALFVPDSPDVRFTVTSTRYLYDCHGLENPFACNQFLSVYVTPNTPAVSGAVYNTVSSAFDDGVMTVIELSNPSAHTVGYDVTIYNEHGTPVGGETRSITPNSTVHLLLHDLGLSNGSGYAVVGYAVVTTSDLVKSTTFKYKFDEWGQPVKYGFGYPFTRVDGTERMVEFNSFIGHTNVLELVNLASVAQIITAVARDASNNVVATFTYDLKPGQMIREELAVPADTYGTIVVSGEDVLVRSFVRRAGEYQIPYVGK